VVCDSQAGGDKCLIPQLGPFVACTIPFLVSGWTALATSISGAMELT